jgi:DNA polymerase-3 subunit epsilon
LCETTWQFPVDVVFECEDGAVSLVLEVPTLLVGFDIESTGLDTQNDEAISYGFAVYRRGILSEQDHFYVLPDVQIHPGAERVHGVSYEQLRVRYRNGDALSARAGASRATQRLLNFAGEGATFVGANPKFDYSMLDATLRRQGVGDLESFGLHLDTVPIIDVVTNDLLIDSDRSVRPRRGLANLCDFYGIEPGRHDAAQDARAACEVLIAQVAHVRQSIESSASPVQSLVDESEPHHFARLRRAIFRIR